MAERHLAIVTDVTTEDWIGGGTLVNDYVAQCARQAGWRVSFIRNNPSRSDWQTFDHAAVAAYFVANIPHLGVPQLLELMQSGRPYVMFRHDVASLCYDVNPAAHPAAPLVKALFDHARANFFISNLQLNHYKRVCEVPRPVLVPPPLDLSAFVNHALPGRAGHLYLGEISRPRGVDESLAQMAASAEPGPRALYGQLTDASLETDMIQAQAQRHAEIPHQAVPDLMNQFRHFYYHPRIIDAFCLKVLEAELCGMEMHVQKENIGRYHYRESAQEIAAFMKKDSAAMILQVLGAG